MKNIKLKVNDIELAIELRDTATARKLVKALPIEAEANRWGDEIYFSIPVTAELEDDASDVMEIGEVGFWVAGSSLAIFFGPTPASQGSEPRAVEPINRVGKINGDVKVLKNVKSGDKISLV